MRILVIGLGSMGKRRIRNLSVLGHSTIAGFDIRSDRRLEAAKKYKIPVYDTFDTAVADFKPNGLVISTEPRSHMTYAFFALENGLDCFIEASVVESDKIKLLAERVKLGSQIIVPSCTMHYFPGPIVVRELISAGMIGKPLNINYQTGQFLPDWHPWEDIKDFYVSNRDTGGAREIVPFELTWLNSIFGDPKPLTCIKTKVSNIEADIDDIYHFCLSYPNGTIANITIDVVSRPIATRELNILGADGRLVFSGQEGTVRYISVDDEDWTKIDVSGGTPETGYINPEEPYIAEMKDFVEALTTRNASVFPNDLFRDARVLDLLNDLEKLGDY